MDRWWGDNIATVATQIDSLGKACAISSQATRVSKIKMTPGSSSDGLDGRRERPELVLKPLEGGISTMFRIDIEHDQV